MKIKDLNTVFMGTTAFSAEILKFLHEEDIGVSSVVTIPDKKKGRGLKVSESPVKAYAKAEGLPILQPEKLNDPKFIETMSSLNPDVILVVAFKKIPQEIYQMPKLGAINLHTSYLPDYRGAAPINWVIINGEKETGITTFLIEEQIDAGNILLQEKIAIDAKETAGTLHDKLLEKGKLLMLKTLEQLTQDSIKPHIQNHYDNLKPAPKLTKSSCRIDFNDTCSSIYNKVRGLTPYPGAWTTLKTKNRAYQIKLLETEPIFESTTQNSGTIRVVNGKIFVSTLDGYISIKELQLEGKKRVNAKDFINGFRDLESCEF